MDATRLNPSPMPMQQHELDAAFVAIAGSGRIPAAVVDINGCILKWSTGFAEVIGRSDLHLRGTSFSSLLVSRADVPAEWDSTAMSWLDGKGDDYVLESRGGVRKRVRISPVAIFGTGDALLGFVVKVWGKEEGAKSAGDSNASLDGMALDGLQANVCVLDMKGRIVRANRAWKEFIEEQCDGRHCDWENAPYLEVGEASLATNEADAKALAKGLKAVLSGKRPRFEMEYACHSEVEKRWFMVNVSSVGAGEDRHVVVSHQAITSRKIVEARLMEVQKLEALGTLAGGVAHDFNNALAAILGSARLALESLDRGHPSADNLATILEAGRRSRGLIEQILSFSRREPRRIQLVSVATAARQTVGLLRATIGSTVQLVDDLGDRRVPVLIDPTQLEQLVMNLGTNAWHALGGRKGLIEVGLRVKRMKKREAARLMLEEGPEYAHLWIRDSGKGIAADDLQRIFDPFFTTKRPGEGTGLGLSVVRGIVAEYGGAIDVATELGSGSTFNVYLPMAEDQPSLLQAEVPEIDEQEGAGLEILVLDDDEVVGSVTEALLKRAGYSVERRSSGAEGIELLRGECNRFAGVVTDLNMPGSSGMDVLDAVRSMKSKMPVIVVSGFLPEDVKSMAAEKGARRLIRKEEVFEVLIPALKDELGGR